MPEIISKEDTPVIVIHDSMNPQTPYVVLDCKGVMRAQFVKQEEADAFAETVNAPEKQEEPALMQEDMRDTAVEHGQEDPEQQKEDDMPRGIAKKKVKAAVKKRTAPAKPLPRSARCRQSRRPPRRSPRRLSSAGMSAASNFRR